MYGIMQVKQYHETIGDWNFLPPNHSNDKLFVRVNQTISNYNAPLKVTTLKIKILCHRILKGHNVQENTASQLHRCTFSAFIYTHALEESNVYPKVSD